MKYIGSASAVFFYPRCCFRCNAAGLPSAKTAAVEEENTQKKKPPPCKPPAWEIRLISGPPPMARLPETQFI
ncbi:MAG: hypothetical protein ACLRP4_08630 [Dialister invisus]